MSETESSGDHSNPWKVLSSQEIYDNPWIQVTEHRVLNAAGNPGIYGMVHFKNLAVGVVPYSNGKIWMVGQFRFPLNDYSWEIPEGGGRLDVHPLATAQRELLEETGMKAAHFQRLLEMDLSNSVSDERAIVYLATGLSFGLAEPEEDEVLHLREISLQEAFELADRGEIRDSLTVAALFRLKVMDLEGKLKGL